MSGFMPLIAILVLGGALGVLNLRGNMQRGRRWAGMKPAQRRREWVWFD